MHRHTVLYLSLSAGYVKKNGTANSLVGTALPLLVILPYIRWRNGGRGVVSLIMLGGWVILVHSLLSHKEFRFIMQVIPITLVLAGYVLSYLFSLKMYRVFGWCGCIVMLLNVPVAVWFSLVHQRGTLDVMTYLRSNITDNSSVLFLMPCHSTPFYSHIHRDINMEFLECPPQLNDAYIDTEKEFYDSPEVWLDRRYSKTHKPHPTHIVIFNTLLPDVDFFLKRHHYKEGIRLFHTFHPLEADMGTHVIVYITD